MISLARHSAKIQKDARTIYTKMIVITGRVDQYPQNLVQQFFVQMYMNACDRR